MQLELVKVEAGVIDKTDENAIVFTFRDLAEQEYGFTLVEKDIPEYNKVISAAMIAIKEIREGKHDGVIKKKLN